MAKNTVPSRLPDGSANPDYFKEWSDWNREKVRASSRENYRKTKRRGVCISDYRVMVVNLLLERDGSDCEICGEPLQLKTVHVDHRKQRSQGGTHAASNLRLVHDVCNRHRPKPRSVDDGE